MARNTPFIILGIVLIASTYSSAAVTVTYHELVTASSHPGIPNVIDVYTGVTSSSRTAISGDSSAETVYGISATAEQTIIDLDFDHTYAAASNAYAKSYSTLHFTTPDSPSYYALSGTYGFNTGNGATIQFIGYLRKSSALPPDWGFLFNNNQRSEETADESFVLGLQGGDYQSLLNGSLTGMLDANTEYEFYTYAEIYMQPHFPIATASGNINLTVTVANTSVPEPTTLAIWSLLGFAGAGFTAGRRHRKGT